MIRQALATLAAAAGLLFAVLCLGALVGWFITGVCLTAPLRVCL